MSMEIILSVALIASLQYVACVALYHSHERRSSIEVLKESPRNRNIIKVVAWCLLAISLFVCNGLQDIERGIPIWLCLISVSGFISLFVSAYKPLQHVKSGLAALGVSALLGSAMFLIGDSVKTSKEVAQHDATNSTT